MRKRLYSIIEISNGNDILSSIYDYFMIIVITASIVPLAFKENYFAFEILDITCVSIFILDYICHWITADFKYNKKSVFSFIRYPFSFMAIIDLISILPTLTALNSGFKLLRLLRMIRAFRVFRIFKAFKYSKSMKIISEVLRKSKHSLMAVGTFAVAYILISALIVFNVEPDTFNNFFEAIYWATVSLTTVGYGDIYPVSIAGRVVTMFSSIFGIAIIALPAGIITAGYMKAIEEPKEEEPKNEELKDTENE